MKTIVLFHSNCPDGFGAALAFWQHYQDQATYIPVNYGQPVPEMELGQETNLFIVDFSYPRPVLKDLSRRVNRLVVLDHHATAKADLAGLEEELQAEQALGDPHIIRFDMDHSGAVMAWMYLHPSVSMPIEDVCPLFFRYLEDRDLWRFKLTKSKEVSTAMRLYPFDFEIWNGLVNQIPKLMDQGEIALKLTDNMVDAMCKNRRWASIRIDRKSGQIGAVVDFRKEKPTAGFIDACEYFAAPVANATVAFSEVGQKLLELHPECDFALYYFDRADKRQWGIRARDGYDATPVAKAFGGGGHPQACGFTTDL